MEESPFAARDFLVESVLDYLETDELFTCAEVNRLWQSVALSLLRRKLVSVSVCCTPDSERAALASALGGSHVCVDIFCSKFSRFRNIARMAGLRPSLVFLSHHVDLGEDKRVVERLREFLHPGSVIVYFKLELVPTVNDAEDATHEGIFGEFLFRVEEDVSAEAAATTSEEADDQPWQQPDGAIPGPSSSTSGSNRERWRPRGLDAPSAPPPGLAADLPGPSNPVAPLRPWPRRPRLASGGERGDVGGCLQRHAEQPAGATHAPAERGIRLHRRRHRRGLSTQPGRGARRAGGVRAPLPLRAGAGEPGHRVQRGRPVRAHEQAQDDPAAHQAARLSPEATPVTPQDRLSRAPTPRRPKSGTESPVGSGQRDAVPANQNMVTVGREGEGKRSLPTSRSRTRSAVPTPVPHTPATLVAGQQVLPEQHTTPESAAEPAPGTQGPEIPEPPVRVAVIDPHDTGRPWENPLMCLYTPEGGLQPMAYAVFGFILLAFAALLFYFLIRQSSGRTHGACDTPACEAYSRLLLASINSSVKPCESFSRYVCDGWRSGHDLNVSEDTILAALGRVYRLAEDSAVPANGQNAMQRATAFYLSCACVSRGECDELQKVKALLRQAGIVWPHRARSPAVVKTLLYTSVRLRWASLLDLEVVPRKRDTQVYLRIPPWFYSLSSKLAEHQPSPGARKRYFDVLRYNFKSEGDIVTDEDIVSFEDTHIAELDIVGLLDSCESTRNEATTSDLFMYRTAKGYRAVWIDALRDYGVKMRKNDDIVFVTNNPTFVNNFLVKWEQYREENMHMFISWGTVQVAALFSNQMLQANFYGSPSKARAGHGAYCFSKTLLFVGDEAVYA
ncbi:uncharacterized protein LOC142559236 [Dermacentor variabilis]|uniref:uncharacterized protein LOC142559236 n=1 Tax=Dermacentor variabilis TaxID=34621 RepID=UPI003F5AF5C4